MIPLLISVVHPRIMETPEFFVILTAAVTATVMVVLATYRGGRA